MKRLILIVAVLVGMEAGTAAQTGGVAYRLRGGNAAARPLTCKATAPVDQYYAVDTDVMSVCTATNTWSVLATAGASLVTGSGTANTVAKFTAGTVVGNSIITDNGTTVSIAGVLSTGGNTVNQSSASTLTQFSGRTLYQLSGNAMLMGTAARAANNVAYFLNNLYINAAGNFEYISTDEGALLLMDGAGQFEVYTTPSGTAGTTATTTSRFKIGNTGKVTFSSGITSDATHTDATLCKDTTSHEMLVGSGTLGICLGTSSERFKPFLADLPVGLAEIMALRPVEYRLDAQHGDPNKLLYGFTAEQGGEVLPALMVRDAEGHPNTFDYLGVVPVLAKAVQQLNVKVEAQQPEIEGLKARVAALETKAKQ